MEFDWLDAPFNLKEITPKEIEESFEDPFSLRLLPELSDGAARYFNLGRSSAERGVFSVFILVRWQTVPGGAGARDVGGGDPVL